MNGIIEGCDFPQHDQFTLGACDSGVDEVTLKHTPTLACDGKDNDWEFTPLGFVYRHGIGQSNLIPFVTRIDNFIAIEGHVNFVLLTFSIFTRYEISNDSDIAIEDIEFCIVDQVENLVILTEENIIKGKLIGFFFGIK